MAYRNLRDIFQNKQLDILIEYRRAQIPVCSWQPSIDCLPCLCFDTIPRMLFYCQVTDSRSFGHNHDAYNGVFEPQQLYERLKGPSALLQQTRPVAR